MVELPTSAIVVVRSALVVFLCTLQCLLISCSRGTKAQVKQRDETALSFLLDNPKVEWGRIEQTMNLEDTKDEDVSSFYQEAADRPVPQAVRTLLEHPGKGTVTAIASTSSLGIDEVRKQLGREQAIVEGEFILKVEQWYRYGAIDVGVGAGGVVALRIDREKW